MGTKVVGALICTGIVVAAIVFVYVMLFGSPQQRFWAIAIPVAAGLFVLFSLVFWIGWNIATAPTSKEK
ncbi:MAG TPA: hypothetical protein ENF26_01175 [Methanomicrobia archaeon]|nr:hypothetical protein [Methanomicrobia archaeon]HEX58743.1 hypothetical protein [Methanomicrobia archaeon]